MNEFLNVSEMRLTSGTTNYAFLKMVAQQASKCSMKHQEEFLALAGFLTANTIMPYYTNIASFLARKSQHLYLEKDIT